LNENDINNPIFNYDQTTDYTITIANGNGCMIVDSQLVQLNTSGAITSNVFVPTAWSPNGDGHNDKLFPLTVNIKTLVFFRVFNRWGQLMFETNVLGNGWDGIFDGKPQVSDVYTWTVQAIGDDGHTYNYAGNSILLR